MDKNIGKKIGKSFSGKYSSKLLDHAKKSATDALKTTSRRVIQKAEEATGDWLVIKLLIKSQNIKKIATKQFRDSYK